MAGFVDFEIEGIEKILSNLDMTKRNVNSNVNSGLREGGQVIKRYIQMLTPTGSGHHGSHASYNVVSSTVKTESGTAYKTIDVGYNDDAYWYMWFVSEGTYSKGSPKGIRPRKQVEKAMELSKDEVTELLKIAIANALRAGG